MSILDYSAVFNQNTLTAFYNELTDEQKATFQADFNTLGDLLRTTNKGLIELLESYVLDRDSENGLLDTGIVINALYTLRNNAKIESEISDFLAFTLKQEQAKTQRKTPLTATNKNGR